MKFLFLLMPLFLISCAQIDQAKVSHLPFNAALVEEMQRLSHRTPAGLELSDVEGKSNRRVYFTALYYQYLTLGQHLKDSSSIDSCPQFHHDKVETDAAHIPKFSLYKPVNIDSRAQEYFPEVVFNRSFSLGDHYEQIEAEVATLCEEGVSDNYYKFDNIVTYYANKKSFHSRPDAMKSILKIPVFSNYYLIKMLQGPHTVAIVHPEEKKIIQLSQTHWFESYVTEAQKLRTNLIKNHMVQR
jgi:hypothetical protein